jgi:translocation and assembly module TamB
LSIDGGLQADRWQFRLAAAQLRYPGLAAWTLRSPGNGWLTKDAAGFSLSKHCWSSEQALLCLGGSRSLKGWQGEFDLQDLPLSYFAHWLPATVKSQGKLSGQGQVRQPASIGEMQASLRLETTAGALLSATEDGDWIPVLAFQPGRGSFDLKRQSMDLAIILPFESGGGIEMEARLPSTEQPLLERPLSGALTVQVPDITVIRDLLEDIEQVEGRLEGEANLSGTLAAPGFRGKLALIDGAVELSRPGISLNDVQIALSGQERGEIDISATASSGPGWVQVKGSAWVTTDGLSSDLRLTGEDFQLIDLPEARVHISPAMNLALSGDKISVQGEVKVPSARIKLKSLPESSVRVSPDQVIVQGQDDETTATPDTRRIDASLRLILGEDVRFEGLGLKAKLAGNLLLTEQPGQLTTASGSINLTEGTYKAYGQNLTIERGRLLYAGGLVTEPGLDVRAVRRPAAGVEVGVEAQGSLRNPRFSLFSQPAMSQSEQLSYLVLGRPLEGGTSSEEGNAMNRAALALGLAGGEFVAGQFGEKLGVDSIGIESGPNEATEEASLVVGKYLSPKLYVGYGVGLFDPVSTIRMSYSISSNWKLVTETSSEASGADLYYTIDRGQ